MKNSVPWHEVSKSVRLVYLKMVNRTKTVIRLLNMHLHRAFRSPFTFFLRRYKRRRYIPGIRIALNALYSSKRGMHATGIGIYRNNSASVHAQAYASEYSYAVEP